MYCKCYSIVVSLMVSNIKLSSEQSALLNAVHYLGMCDADYVPKRDALKYEFEVLYIKFIL